MTALWFMGTAAPSCQASWKFEGERLWMETVDEIVSERSVAFLTLVC